AQQQATIGSVDELPPGVRWVACDAGIPPADVLAALARLRAQLGGVAGLFWTLKLVRDSDAAHLQRTLARLSALGFRNPVAAQLPAHRRDLLVYARVARVG
ncbi:MAG: hypothetical protein FJ102_21180, partial [Deltaproteobacteria bacterium]|nr:hypothetical protein [Deltaproteobacteria bacterium]